jgi:CheY-like chemotaxis protein
VTVHALQLGEQVELRVTDTGIGVTADQLHRLFVAFERLDARRSSVEGTGIGLALSRQLVRAMGGEIGVHSQLDRGSTFWIRLPRATRAGEAAAAAPALAPAPATREAQRRRVLYVEDNAVNALLMRAMLARLPEVELDHSEDPIEAIERVRVSQPALLLLDIELPGIDGFELLRRLRDDERTRAIPAIAVSAGAMPADIHRALQAGFSAYLTKPLDLADLLQAVKSHLQHSADSAQAG